MLTKPKIACAIIEGISYVKEDEELQDFVVEVEGKEFKCHRLILSACSEFFRGLLRSRMKESQKQRTKLEGVSMETFATILETLYTGCENLTRDNMLNVWQAADQLLIKFVSDNCVDFITSNFCNETIISVWKVASQLRNNNIIELCETFLRNNTTLANWEIIYSTANFLGSDLILSHVRDFIKKNYEHVIKCNAFLCLLYNDLLEIIQSQDLVVSCEDVVIESIFKWIKCDRTDNSEATAVGLSQNEKDDSFGVRQGAYNTQIFHDGQHQPEGDANENTVAITEFSIQDRQEHFKSLFFKTRLSLVNSVTLEKLSRDTLVMGNETTREMVMDAFLYNSIGRQHGVWSNAAVHRSCSALENVCVMGNRNGYFWACSYNPKFRWLEIPSCKYLATSTSVKIVSYMTDIFAIGDVAENSSLCFFIKNDWSRVKSIPGNGWLGVAVEEFVYLINSSHQQIKRFDPRLGNCLLEDLISFPTNNKIEHICSFDLFILAFCSDVVNETAVHCLDTRCQRWKKLDRLEGSAKNIVSFRKEKALYVLQRNGNLWEIDRDGWQGVNMTLVEILSCHNIEMCGAIYVNNTLRLVLGEKKNPDKTFSLFSKLFGKISLSFGGPDWSNIIPAIIEKSCSCVDT
ncbi:unnamed protein product [Lymnaea stagnalis]|uniref:BTB domain-containing protein n=1 Tax=Lymnaea stagnalis TaxID=6523 RepID=A0AAV2HZN7_LYMST